MANLETKPTPQAFGSPGGKAHLAKKISSIMPEHTTYVEPYAGGAAVFFYKRPSKREALNDLDREIAFALRFIRNMTPEQYRQLKRKNWVVNQRRFDRLKNMRPKSNVDRFYKFYYLKKGSYRNLTENVDVGNIGSTLGIDRLPKVQFRLKGVVINSADALKMIDKYDGKGTLFYLDPPYPSTSEIGGNAPGFTQEDLERLISRLRRIEGKFILSMDTANASKFGKWMHIKRMKTMKAPPEGGYSHRMEVVATNYSIKSRGR